MDKSFRKRLLERMAPLNALARLSRRVRKKRKLKFKLEKGEMIVKIPDTSVTTEEAFEELKKIMRVNNEMKNLKKSILLSTQALLCRLFSPIYLYFYNPSLPRYNYGDIVRYKYINEYKGLSSCQTRLVNHKDEAILSGQIRYIAPNNTYDISLRVPDGTHIRDAFSIKESDIIEIIQTKKEFFASLKQQKL